MRTERLTYSVKEVAEALGVCRATVDAAIHSGQIRAVKIGNRNLIPAQALRDLLATPSNAAE